MHESLPDFHMPDEAEVSAAADAFRMLADPTRVKILWALMHGENSVACLADLADVSPTAVSQHLAKLRLAGLVKGRRQGTFVYYTPANRDVCDLLTVLLGEDSHTSDTGIASLFSSTDRRPRGRRSKL